MPWSGGAFTRTNGVNTGSTLWVQDRDDGTKILATRHDTNDQDMADGISSTLEKSGSNAATGNLNIGSNRLTAVADGTAKTDAATVNQIVSNAPAFQATDTGTANAHVIALSPAITAYAAGQEITFKSGAASTGASTLNVNTVGVKAIKKLHDQDIAAGDIESGSIVTAVYDGTNFQMTSQVASAVVITPGGSNTQVQYNSSGSFAGSANFTFNGTSATVANPLFLPDGSASAPALSNTGDTNTGLAFIAADTVGVVTGGTEQFRFGSNPIPGGSKNMLINGSMAVAQRGSQTGIGGSDAYTLDQWKLDDTGGCQARYTVSQGTSGGISGKEPWMSINVTTAEAAEAAAEKNGWNQFVEGNNTRAVANSSGQIKATSLGFDIKFKKGGGSGLSTPYKICVGVYAGDADYMWVENVNITADDTWEHKSFSTTALAQAASAIDTSQGYRIQFMMLAGSNYTDGDEGWNSGGGGKPATTHQDNLADATGNILGITNVQWEVGSVATDFAHLDYGTTLNKCYRYLEILGKEALYVRLGVGTVASSSVIYYNQMYSSKRAPPSVTMTGTIYANVYPGGSTGSAISAVDYSSAQSAMVSIDSGTGMTAGSCGLVGTLATTGDYLTISAEL